MKFKGVDYDLGNEYGGSGSLTRPVFSTADTQHEIEIIKNDLHCNAIRLNGKDIDRIAVSGELAIDQGLSVWVLPKNVDATPQDTLSYLVEAAQAAEKLRQRSPEVVFVVGCEFMLFMKGILDGANIMERIGNGKNWERVWRGEHNKPLNDVLAAAVSEVRKNFHGAVTYASLPLETVDWSIFDYVGIDHYREDRNEDTYRQGIERYAAAGKPIVITELGCCSYKGAEEKGGRGWMVLDTSTNPPHVQEGLVRDEATQAQEDVELLRIADSANVEGTFVYTFSAPIFAYNENPLFDYDMVNYGMVTTYADKMGTTYPDLPWDPKESFYAIADYYATH